MRDIVPIPNEGDSFLLDVTEAGKLTKLKVKCLHRFQNEVLTAFAQFRHLFDTMQNTSNTVQHPLYPKCHRVTRFGTKIPSSLVCAEYGAIELNHQTRKPLQTYLYRLIRGIRFASDDESGILLHIGSSGGSNSSSSSGGVRNSKLFLM